MSGPPQQNPTVDESLVVEQQNFEDFPNKTTIEGPPQLSGTKEPQREVNELGIRLHDVASDIEITIDNPTADTAEIASPPGGLLETGLPEAAAAHAAVVLAKTQATAARAENDHLKRELMDTKATLQAETAEGEFLTRELDATRNKYLELDKELAIEKTRLEELRKRADQEHWERLRLAKKLEAYEAVTERRSPVSRLFSKMFKPSKHNENLDDTLVNDSGSYS